MLDLERIFGDQPAPSDIDPAPSPQAADGGPIPDETAGGPTAAELPANWPEVEPEAPADAPEPAPGPFDDWIPRPDVAGCLGLESPGLPESARWWARTTFDGLPEVPDARTPKPGDGPCPWCGRLDWWRAVALPDVIRCGWCHPPVSEAGIVWLNREKPTPRPGLAADVLQAGRRGMATRCEAAAQAILQEAGVVRVEYHNKGLRGRSWAKQKRVLIPRPTTRRRLYVVAHEAGHVALGHSGGKAHRQEYEAERYASEAMRRHGIPVPRKELENAKRYVAGKIRHAIRSGARTIDREAAAWCRAYLSPEVIAWLDSRPQRPASSGKEPTQ